MGKYTKKIGISIYPEKIGEKETIEYVQAAAKAGLKRIFANLLLVENDEKGWEQINMQTRVFKVAKDLGFDVILDVNPSVYKNFKLDPLELEFFRKMNVTGIRLDEDFGGEIEAKLSNNTYGMKIELNASSGTKTVDKALEMGANKDNLMVCHNFYPMEYTGLNYEWFKKLSKHFIDAGLRVGAFITLPKDQKGRGPWDVNDGMPTVELDRKESLFDQARHLLATDMVTDIIISQQAATMEQLEELKEIIAMEEDLIFKIVDEGETTENELKVIKHPHFNRPDINDYFIRSTMTRVVYKQLSIPPRDNKRELKPGDIVIPNDGFGRYKGEIHIIRKNMPMDERKNYIGRISDFDKNFFEFAKPGRKFRFIRGGKDGR